MGSSLNVNKDRIDQNLIVNCKISTQADKSYSLVDFRNSILLLNSNEIHSKVKLEESIKIKDFVEIRLDTIYCIKKITGELNSCFIGYSDTKKLKSINLYFDSEADLDVFWSKYGDLCRSHRDGNVRNLAIILNPISGKKKSLQYFEKILKPMLEECEITYTCRSTSSSKYIDEWVETLDLIKTPYTDFIMIGGDGILNQFINAVAKRDDSDQILKIPIGILPGGSTNATACDLSGKNPVMAATNVCKGNTIHADVMKVTLKNQKAIYTTTVTWGCFADIVHDAEGWRSWFGSCRYQVCGARHLLCKCRFKTYKAEILFKNDLECPEISAQVGGKSEVQEMNETEECFEKYEKKEFSFFSLVSHECRSSNDKSILAPFARYSDNKLNFVSVNAKNRVGMVYFMSKLVHKGDHMKLKSFDCKRATEAIIKPISDSYFNIDGEIFESDEAHIKLIPNYLNLIGKIIERTNDEQKYSEELEVESS